MSARPLVSFVAWDAVTSLGESATETALLLRAGLNNVAPSHYIDAAGERVMMCSAPALSPVLRGVERAAALAQIALRRLLERGGTFERPVMLLAVPERYAIADLSFNLNDEGKSFVQALRKGLPTNVRDIEIEAFPFGRAAGALALRRAIELVEPGRLVIWGGVETCHDWAMLEALERADRLMTVENIDGIRPGEAAAFIAVSPPDPDRISVQSIGTGREVCHVGTEPPCRSEGLSTALATAVDPLRAAGRRTNCWLLDNSHEAYATQELQNIIARFGDVLGLRAELQTPLKELGDVGAAAMPLLAVLGAEAWRMRYANDDMAVITGCSERGARAAILIAADQRFQPLEVIQ